MVNPGQQANLFGWHIWYFRAAPNQTNVEFQVRTNAMDGAFQIQIATADGVTVLGRYGLVGPRGVVKARVKPGEMYRLVCCNFGHHPIEVIPANYPLILSRTAEEWFAPPVTAPMDAAGK